MTKASDRYARWFGIRVPLVSRGGTVLITTIGAIIFSVPIYMGLPNVPMLDNILNAALLCLPMGVLLYILILLLQKMRFTNPSTNSEFLSLLSRVHQKVVLSSRTHIWTRRSEDVFIASTYNPLFDAIIVSEPMVDLIMESPESGEVLLAFHQMRIPRTRWFGDLIGNVIIFTMVAVLSSLTVVPVTFSMISMILSGYYYGFTMITSLGTLFLGPIFFVLITKGSFWRHEPAFVAVQQIYGMHPQVAKVQVEQGITVNEEEAQTVIWGVRDWEKSKRVSRRYGIATFVAVPSYFLGLYILTLIDPIPYFYYFSLIALFPFIFAGVLALVSYFLLKRWDKNAMGEVFQKTTDYDEPIWAD